MEYFHHAFIFLIRTVFQLAFFLILLRLFFQFFQVSFHNPFSQFIFKASNPMLAPFHKVLPRSGKVDLATVLLLILIKAAELSCLTLLTAKTMPAVAGLIVWPLGELMAEVINVIFFAIVLVALLSWIAPQTHTPFTVILTQITEPFLSPIRRRLPAMSIDLSPLILLIGLKLLDILLVSPLTLLGKHLSVLH